jgi:predicted hydrolase (HD superfamily)
MVGIDLGELITEVIIAMREIADELGLDVATVPAPT